MRKCLFIGVAFLLALSGAAIAATATASDGWYRVRGYARWPAVPFEIGTGATTGMMGKAAVYFSGDAGWATVRNSQAKYGALQQNIPLAAWRGKRLRLTLRLKDDGDARAWVSLNISDNDRSSVRAETQRNDLGSSVWQSHQFVLDVPADANNLFLSFGLTDEGKVWADDLRLEAVSTDVPVTPSEIIRPRAYGSNSWLDSIDWSPTGYDSFYYGTVGTY
ncbi:MAG: hypothetical protein JO256_02895 [Alphaproteobacteria bacterium]|nr:hypothetical protein [Alphaproteobacteria bacterium]